MAAAAAQYYFRFRIWWCHSLLKINIYQHTKFHRRTLIHGWDIITSSLEKQTSAILKNTRTSGFDFDIIIAVHMSFCTSLPNFVHIGPPTAEKWRHVDFQDGGWIPAMLDFRGPIMGFFEKPVYDFLYVVNSDQSFKLLSFWENRVLVFAFWRQTDRRTDGQTKRWTGPTH